MMFGRIRNLFSRSSEEFQPVRSAEALTGELAYMVEWAAADVQDGVEDELVTITDPVSLQPNLLYALYGVAYARRFLDHYAVQARMVGDEVLADVLGESHVAAVAALDALRRATMATVASPRTGV
ncbi:hypothetical protein [Embleya sp. NPDC059237]|uniref:hypothetical protein n=1 Tax=Embleya sp. NPDC059237 TaxID=3346784 RepID=UPI0036BC1C6B